MKLFVVDWMVVEKGEGGYYDEDGNAQWFGYVGCGNFFRLIRATSSLLSMRKSIRRTSSLDS